MQLNPFRWFFERKSSLRNPSPALLDIFAAGSGGSISSEQALRCPPVQCAVRAIAETVGSLPCHIFGRESDGSKKRDTTHAAESLVALEANPWTSAGALRQQLVADALVEGNGFAAVLKVDGRPRELHRLAPRSTRIEVTDSGEPLYLFNSTKGERRYEYDEVVHVASPITLDGYTGIAPTQLASRAIQFALELESHGIGFFRNAVRPGGVLKHPRNLTGPAQQRLKEQIAEDLQGGTGTGKPLLLEEGLEWQSVALTSVEAQYHELRGFAISEIARAFRVPPVLLMDYGRATWGNSEESGRQFLTFTMMPWIKALEFGYGRALLSREERPKYYFEFITDDLVRADISKRMAAYRQAVDGGFMTPNEVRAAENRSSLPGGDELRPASKPSAPANDNHENRDREAA